MSGLSRQVQKSIYQGFHPQRVLPSYSRYATTSSAAPVPPVAPPDERQLTMKLTGFQSAEV